MHSHLRQARKKQGLTQAEVAARVGRDQGTVARWETAQHPVPADIAPALADILGLTVLEVLYGDGAGSRPGEPMARRTPAAASATAEAAPAVPVKKVA